MHVIELSYMYPSPRYPTSGVFVERQARELARHVDLDVVSPVPWAPAVLRPLSARWRAYAAQPRVQRRHGLRVHHPRYLQPVGQWSVGPVGALMAAGARRVVARLARERGADVIHAHQLLPEGLAALLLGRRLGRPVVCTLHGADAYAIPFHDRLALAAARRVARGVDAFVAVAPALTDALARVAPDHAPVHVVPNGVDVEEFRPLDRAAARRRLGDAAEGRVVLYAGMLVALKGVDVLLHAFAALAARRSDVRLVIAGGSAERTDRGPELAALAARLGCAGRVRFVGRRPHEEMPLWFAAADVFALASRSEGFPTVVREAVACGTPCVVSDLPGIADEIGPRCGTECGLVVPPDDAPALAAALERALARPWDRAALRRRALGWSWGRNAETVSALFRGVRRARRDALPEAVACRG